MNDEMQAWLGPAAEEMDEDQTERFAAAWEAAGKRYPDEDDQDRRDAMLSAAVQYLLKEGTIDEAGERRAQTRAESLVASAAAQQWAIMAVEDGMAEAVAARRAGIDRMWLRKQLGKR